MDTQISETGVERENSHPPQEAYVRSLSDEQVVDQ